MNTRETALKALYDIEYGGAYSNMVVKNVLHGDMLPHDKAFITALVYGTIDKKLTLDYIISQFSRIKPKKISKYILLILRMGIYQIKFMDSVPHSAAVNESVKLAKRYGHGASAGFVNGLLRTVIREEIKYPQDKTEYLSVRYSYPKFIIEKWINEFGEDFCEELIGGFEKEPELILRPNTLKVTSSELKALLEDKGIEARERDGAIICSGFDIAEDDLYKNGMYTVQDIAAQCAAKVLAPKSGDSVIDMCAAPGGKTTHMAELMKNKGKISAFDIFEHKVELIEKNAQRLGIDIIKTEVKSALEHDKNLEESADKVLCDVPCSGTGILRRKPDIKWNRDENYKFPPIQKKILENGLSYLKKGGELVYSTCSIEKEENEGVTSGIENAEITWEKTFYPHIDDTDGFYICKIKKL